MSAVPMFGGAKSAWGKVLGESSEGFKVIENEDENVVRVLDYRHNSRGKVVGNFCYDNSESFLSAVKAAHDLSNKLTMKRWEDGL